VRSDRKPAIGSEIASQIRETKKTIPMAAGEMASTSVENFIRYMLVSIPMNPTPIMGAEKTRSVEVGRRSGCTASLGRRSAG
jgi:hypothetical protein